MFQTATANKVGSASSVTSVLVVNMGTFLVSALLILGLRAAGYSRSTPTGPRGWRSNLEWSAQGMAYLRSHPAMLPAYLMLLILFATLYLLNTLLPPYAVDVLDVGSSGLGLIDDLAQEAVVDRIAARRGLGLVGAGCLRGPVAAIQPAQHQPHQHLGARMAHVLRQ